MPPTIKPSQTWRPSPAQAGDDSALPSNNFLLVKTPATTRGVLLCRQDKYLNGQMLLSCPASLNLHIYIHQPSVLTCPIISHSKSQHQDHHHLSRKMGWCWVEQLVVMIEIKIDYYRLILENVPIKFFHSCIKINNEFISHLISYLGWFKKQWELS